MARNRQKRGKPINGMLLLDKPGGVSSNKALQMTKHLFDAQKAGHTGSLDPIATGLLPLCFGQTTKVSNFFLHGDKSYAVKIRLGITTETGDREGTERIEKPINFSQEELLSALDQFRGEFEQVPPMYSALKQNGQPLYKLARQGVEVERKARQVTVHELTLDSWEKDVIDLSVSCSGGFYVRSLATELGEILGCGAHVEELRRTRVGTFSLDKAVTLDELESMDSQQERESHLLPTDQSICHLPRVNLPDNIAVYLCRGQAVKAPDIPDGGLVRIYADGTGFLGIGEITIDRKVAPKKLFSR